MAVHVWGALFSAGVLPAVCSLSGFGWFVLFTSSLLLYSFHSLAHLRVLHSFPDTSHVRHCSTQGEGGAQAPQLTSIEV